MGTQLRYSLRFKGLKVESLKVDSYSLQPATFTTPLVHQLGNLQLYNL
jgi:hypothetical protein